MVKITNEFGDVKRGVQGDAVYQQHYGKQIRRTHKEHKNADTLTQRHQRDRFRTGIDFAKGLTKAQRDFIKSYMAEAGITSPEGLPTTWYTYAKKIAMTVPEVSMEVEAGEGGFSGTYATWGCFRPITLSNSGSAQSNYQKIITLTTANFDYSKCKEDGGDIRFAASNGSTPLPYHIEDWNYNGDSKIWVKVDSIPEGNSTIYIYYNKSSATSESNFDNTFILGELWDNATLDTEKWPTVNGAPTYTINTADHYLEITNVADGWNAGNGFTSKLFNFPAEYIIERARGSGGFQQYINSTVTDLTHILLGNHHGSWSNSDMGVAFAQLQDAWANETHGRNAGIGGNFDYSSGGSQGQIATVEWTIHKLGGTITIKEAETTRVSEANAETPDRIHIGLSKLSGHTFGTVRLYAFKIRKYADPEPTSEVGEEETAEATKLKAFSIHHPAIKSFEIIDTGIKEEQLSNLEDHISTVATRKNLDLAATAIKVITLADQEYTFPVQ